MNPTEARMDTLKATINSGVEQAAAVLSDMLGDTIELQAPQVKLYNDATSYLQEHDLRKISAVVQQFSGMLSGSAILTFPPHSALHLVGRLLGADCDSEEVGAECESALTEVGNILLNGVMGAFGNLGATELEFEVPTYRETSIHDLLLNEGCSEGALLLTKVQFSVLNSDIVGDVKIFFGVNGINDLMTFLDMLMDSASDQK